MIPKPPEHVVTITATDTLARFVERMHRREWIAVDTEFLRERTYYPGLCLVQVADRETVGLIDVLAIDDLAPLAQLLRDPGVLKIFHSAEQDLEVLYQRFGDVPAPLFDTQIAAALVGQDDQMGYARLIAALLDVDLPKAHTRTDWSKRPLPAGALDYAADDVRYLAVAYDVLREQLIARDRLGWLTTDFDRLADPGRFDIDPSRAWRRLRNWHRLDPGQQQVLAALAEWREREAMTSDRPRKWILGDDALMEIARRRPADRDTLAAIRSLPEKTAARHGNALLACVERGRSGPDAPLAPMPQAPDDQQKYLTRVGMERLAERAEQTGIAAAVLASRKDIGRIAAGERDVRVLAGWRANAAGNAVLEAIERAANNRCEQAAPRN